MKNFFICKNCNFNSIKHYIICPRCEKKDSMFYTESFKLKKEKKKT